MGDSLFFVDTKGNNENLENPETKKKRKLGEKDLDDGVNYTIGESDDEGNLI